MDETWLAQRLILFIPLLLSLTVHEWAHARAAWALGDDTARLMGRMTLDPLAHIDPVGTLILPLLGVPFGWAKPVPVDPFRFRPSIDGRVGMMLTAAAGPLSNLVLAAICGVPLLVGGQLGVLTSASPFGQVLLSTTIMNVALAVLNLLPIPPLDGSRVVEGLVPPSLRPAWDRLQGVGPFLLLLVLAPLLLCAGPFAAMVGLLPG